MVSSLACSVADMSFLDFFRSEKTGSAALAKERLQIIVAHERGNTRGPNFLPQLQQEILDVVRKYVQISEEHIKLSVDKRDGCEVLELNISMSDFDKNI
jgi:cell division topological specificity factor